MEKIIIAIIAILIAFLIRSYFTKQKEEKNAEKKKSKKSKNMSNQDKKDQPKKKNPKKKKIRSENITSSFASFVNETKEGEKKDLSKEMNEKYLPANVEASWYSWWEKKKIFSPENGSKKPRFVIMLPPPNVTGNLHIGHALTSSIQDCLIRFYKMSGHNCLYLPGVDHAGIATQVVVEKTLMGKTGKTRHDLGREDFVKKVWEWKHEYGNRIKSQLKRMGSSLDWTRDRFTMDEGYSLAVKEAFIRLFKKGNIYREKRLVNWDCTLNTAISNIEVDRIELFGRRLAVPGYNKKVKFGYLWSFGYPVENSDEQIIVATTRPETMLGDTAIAIHPKDDRYKHLHGKFCIHPFNGRKIPIICDPILVDMEFGTGAVKVTPAHDQSDFDCGKRNKLEFINILTDDGRINENGGSFAGMKRYDARTAVLEGLEKKGLFKEEKAYNLKVGICSRSKDIIEPIIKPQWFMNCQELAKRSIEAVKNGKLKLIPKMQEKVWFEWLSKIHEWCISRQLWWGHRIPAYFVKLEGLKDVEHDENRLKNEYWMVASSEREAREMAISFFKTEKFTLEQDEDVLDTWFSSGLFPFATLGWPKETADMKDFFPGSLLETGSDILFFWVARMVMMSLALTDKLPFHTVFLHSMVRDKSGKKMSKSDGNIIDPIDCIEGIKLKKMAEKLDTFAQLDESKREKGKKMQKKQFPNGIPECGTDGLRFTLLNYTTNNGIDINMDIMKVFGYRTFCNKIWNATRFAMIFADLKKFNVPNEIIRPSINLFINKWILNELNNTINTCNENLKKFSFHNYTNALYDFFMKQFCAIYLEVLKSIVKGNNEKEKEETKLCLYMILETFYRLLHPAMPFISEELWQRLPQSELRKSKNLSIFESKFPQEKSEWKNEKIHDDMNVLMSLILKIRSIKGMYTLTNKKRPKIIVITSKSEEEKVIGEQSKLIQDLSFCGDIAFLKSKKEITKGYAIETISQSLTCCVLLKGIIDLEKEMKKQIKARDKKEKYIAGIEKKMGSKKFEKTPEHIKKNFLKKKENALEELKLIKDSIEKLDSMK